MRSLATPPTESLFHSGRERVLSLTLTAFVLDSSSTARLAAWLEIQLCTSVPARIFSPPNDVLSSLLKSNDQSARALVLASGLVDLLP